MRVVTPEGQCNFVTQDSDAIIGIYQRHAKAWAEQRRAHRPETVWLDPFLALMPVGGTVLDVGCGSGQPIAQHLIGAGCQITGVDTSAELLDQALGALPQGKWIAADMRRLNLNQSFDGILAWNSFFHLTQNEQRAMFQVFAKHSHKGTVLMFTSGPELVRLCIMPV